MRLVVWGKSFNYFDLKWSFLAAVIVFELGSLVCATAPSSNALIVGRTIAGIGAAGVAGGCYTIIGYTMHPDLRPALTGTLALSLYVFTPISHPASPRRVRLFLF